MTCAELEILLCDYVDGTLRAEQRTALEAHLSACPACTELAADIQGVTAFIGRVPEAQPPAELMTRILHYAPTGRKSRCRRARRCVAAAILGQTIFRWVHPGRVATALRDGHGDDHSFLFHAGALRPYRAPAVAPGGLGSGQGLAKRRRPIASHLGPEHEVLRQFEAGDRDPIASQRVDRSGSRRSRRRGKTSAQPGARERGSQQ